jgi:hypothetical protein
MIWFHATLKIGQNKDDFESEGLTLTKIKMKRVNWYKITHGFKIAFNHFTSLFICHFT